VKYVTTHFLKFACQRPPPASGYPLHLRAPRAPVGGSAPAQAETFKQQGPVSIAGLLTKDMELPCV
jgi:hypothetical protein